MFGNFNDIFSNMDRMVNDMFNDRFNPGLSLMNNMLMPTMNGPLTPFGHGGGNMFSMMNTGMPSQNFSFSSSITSFSNDGSGRPQIVQSTKSQICGPDGLKETTETVKDSRTGMHQMTYGRHINDRSHIKQKVRNIHNGDEEEEDEYINLDEDEAEKFHDEFKQKKTDFLKNHPMYHSIGYRNQNNQNNRRLAIANGPSTSKNNHTICEQNSRPSSSNKKAKETEENKKQKKIRKPYIRNNQN